MIGMRMGMRRVISQDQRISMPADYTIFYVEDCTIMATTVDSPFGKLMATYSSEELAMKAFNRMNVCLINGNGYRFPSEKLLCAG